MFHHSGAGLGQGAQRGGGERMIAGDERHLGFLRRQIEQPRPPRRHRHRRLGTGQGAQAIERRRRHRLGRQHQGGGIAGRRQHHDGAAASHFRRRPVDRDQRRGQPGSGGFGRGGGQGRIGHRKPVLSADRNNSPSRLPTKGRFRKHDRSQGHNRIEI
ncbi:hypothetical protein GCM10009099_07550 [Caenispirillum bisanense]